MDSTLQALCVTLCSALAPICAGAFIMACRVAARLGMAQSSNVGLSRQLAACNSFTRMVAVSISAIPPVLFEGQTLQGVRQLNIHWASRATRCMCLRIISTRSAQWLLTQMWPLRQPRLPIQNWSCQPVRTVNSLSPRWMQIRSKSLLQRSLTAKESTLSA